MNGVNPTFIHEHSFIYTLKPLFLSIFRSSYKDASSFIQESASRIQVLALEENVKDFGLTYFGGYFSYESFILYSRYYIRCSIVVETLI